VLGRSFVVERFCGHPKVHFVQVENVTKFLGT